ncbi:hypothetical protein T01_7330 [Trichinella spiralis]|uniref:Uncharacterized protein n=1 Tax=Trichinella spiralis TaxID=6334 RepID=A0A0V0Z775_TRISP|nr:hypothetical protein T01_7330 [Trichinella spiralis]
MISETTLVPMMNVTASTCQAQVRGPSEETSNSLDVNEEVKYLRMFVMPHLEQTDVNMTKHGVQSERKLKTVQLMMLSVIIDVI